MNELLSYDASVDGVVTAGRDLLAQKHFASDTIMEHILELEQRWKELKAVAAQRTQMLRDAMEVQGVCNHSRLHITIQYHSIYSYWVFVFYSQYYQDANEADVWMNDRAGVAVNTDYGTNEDKAVNSLKKHKVHCNNDLCSCNVYEISPYCSHAMSRH